MKALLIAALMAAPPVYAQTNCADREQIVSRLESKYGETRAGAGLMRNGGLVEVYASEETGTWTILITTPSGLSCIQGAGRNWQSGPVEPQGTAL